MEIIWTAIMGLIQGATEFLPVSSSGHLAAAQMAAEGEEWAERLGDNPLVLEILLHLATLFAVAIFYRREISEGLKGFFRGAGALPRGRFTELVRTDDGANLAFAVIVGTIPTGTLGILLTEPAGAVATSPVKLGLAFLGTACLLAATFWWRGGSKRLSWRIALAVGAVQGIAVLPGISRSGVTIAVGLALGLSREDAVRFSFLLSLPAILGAALLELDVDSLNAGGHLLACLAGGLSAFTVGLLALHLLVRIVRRGRLWAFAPYVAIVAVASLLLY